MKNGCCNASNGLGLLLARVPLGIVLALAGYKLKTSGGTEGFMDHSLATVPAYMPAWFAHGYPQFAPYLAMAVGGLLVVGLMTRVSGLLATLMLAMVGLSFTGTSGFFDCHAIQASQLFKAPFTYGVLGLVAMFAGPGGISLDGLLFGRRRSRSAATAE